mmetsp:Transcript_2498/g.5479  ORF Transcript_2498/g.5479 Transcript_2498/m.5479 type:complete len:374 (-) Transcript_2498:32-1153(-)
MQPALDAFHREVLTLLHEVAPHSVQVGSLLDGASSRLAAKVAVAWRRVCMRCGGDRDLSQTLAAQPQLYAIEWHGICPRVRLSSEQEFCRQVMRALRESPGKADPFDLKQLQMMVTSSAAPPLRRESDGVAPAEEEVSQSQDAGGSLAVPPRDDRRGSQSSSRRESKEDPSRRGSRQDLSLSRRESKQEDTSRRQSKEELLASHGWQETAGGEEQPGPVASSDTATSTARPSISSMPFACDVYAAWQQVEFRHVRGRMEQILEWQPDIFRMTSSSDHSDGSARISLSLAEKPKFSVGPLPPPIELQKLHIPCTQQGLQLAAQVNAQWHLTEPPKDIEIEPLRLDYVSIGGGGVPVDPHCERPPPVHRLAGEVR